MKPETAQLGDDRVRTLPGHIGEDQTTGWLGEAAGDDCQVGDCLVCGQKLNDTLSQLGRYAQLKMEHSGSVAAHLTRASSLVDAYR
jgi:hypothetical protein